MDVRLQEHALLLGWMHFATREPRVCVGVRFSDCVPHSRANQRPDSRADQVPHTVAYCLSYSISFLFTNESPDSRLCRQPGEADLKN